MLDTITTPAPNACLECSERWHYIGTDQPDATCPDCGSAAVTPIGTLDIDSVEELDVATGVDLQYWRVAGTDATERTFTFMYATDGEVAPELVWLVVTSDDVQHTYEMSEQQALQATDQLPLGLVEEELQAARRGDRQPRPSRHTTGGGR